MHPKILAGALGCESCHHVLLSYGQCSQLVKSINVSQGSAGTPGAEGSSPDPMQFVWTLQGCPSWMLWEGDGAAEQLQVLTGSTHNLVPQWQPSEADLCKSLGQKKVSFQSPVQMHCVGMMRGSLSSGGLPGAMCMLGC